MFKKSLLCQLVFLIFYGVAFHVFAQLTPSDYQRADSILMLKDAGFPDRIRWIKAAAQKFNYMDTMRLVYSGGQPEAKIP